jgi:DedD protein
MSDSPETHLQLKKRARRRLVGAVAVAGLAAVVLPMVMDEEPKQQVQDVRIIIPDPEATPFAPTVKPPGETKEEEPAEPPAARTVEPIEPAPKPVEKPVEKPAPKPVEKPVGKPPAKPAGKPVENLAEAQRAAAILSGKSMGELLEIRIGAFSNPVNVRQLQTKLGEIGIKVFTEPLESPEGRKTRVRAGPFDSREAAEQALKKMKRIGVNGVIAPKQ